MFNIRNCCRMCLRDDDYLFKIDCKDIAVLCTKIHQHFSVLISESDEISTKICQQCSNKISNFSIFYDTVQHNQQQLKLWLDIQKKVCGIRELDIDCIKVEDEAEIIVESDLEIDENNKNNITNNAKRTAPIDDLSTNSNNSAKKRITSTINTINNNSSVNNDTISNSNNVGDDINTENITENSVNNADILISSSELTNVTYTSENDVRCSEVTTSLANKNKEDIKMSFYNLSNKTKKLLKKPKSKNSYVKINRLPILEFLIEKVREDNKTKPIRSLRISNRSKSCSAEIVGDTGTKTYSLKVNYKNEIDQQVKNRTNVKKNIKKKITKNSTEINEEINIKSSETCTKDEQNNNSTNTLKETTEQSNIQIKEKNTTETQQISNIKKIPVIITAGNSNSSNLSKNIENNCKKSESLLKYKLNPVDLGLMMKKSENSNIINTTTTDNNSVVKKYTTQSSIIDTTTPTVSGPQNMALPKKTPNITNMKKAPKELYTRELYPDKLPKGQSVTESINLQNKISASNIRKNHVAQEQRLSTSSVINITTTSSTIPSTISTISTSASSKITPTVQKLNCKPIFTTASTPQQSVPASTITAISQIQDGLKATANNFADANKNLCVSNNFTMLSNQQQSVQARTSTTISQIQDGLKGTANNFTDANKNLCVSNNFTMLSNQQQSVQARTSTTISEIQGRTIATANKTTDANKNTCVTNNFTMLSCPQQSVQASTSKTISETQGGIIATANNITDANKMLKVYRNIHPKIQQNNVQHEANSSVPTPSTSSMLLTMFMDEQQKKTQNSITNQQQIQSHISQNQMQLINNQIQQNHQQFRNCIKNQQQIQSHISKNQMQHINNQMDQNHQQLLIQSIQPKQLSHNVETTLNNTPHIKKFKILTVPELNQRVENNQLIYNKLPNPSTSSAVLTPITSIGQMPSDSVNQSHSQSEQISKNNVLLHTNNVEQQTCSRIGVRIISQVGKRNQLSIKLNNLTTGQVYHYRDLTESQSEAVKKSLSCMDKSSVSRFKSYHLDIYAKNLLNRINLNEFCNHFSPQ